MHIVYCTPALYMAGGVERVLTLKANYLADVAGCEVTIVLTDGKGRQPYFPLSERVRVVQLDVGFETLWNCSFLQKIPVYLQKQRRYRRLLAETLERLHPDITVSTLRREINFLCSLHDGSRKVGELHVNRANYRNFELGDSNAVKRLFSHYWSWQLLRQLRRLDRFVVLTEEDRQAWPELDNVSVVPNPLPGLPVSVSTLQQKRVIAAGRYVYQKGFDMLLQAWQQVEGQHPDWQLVVYGEGDRTPYEQLAERLHLDPARCRLCGPTQRLADQLTASGLFVFPSRFEGFGMVLLEAMACGLPCVSFACPCGPRDIVTHDVNGLLVPAGDVAALAEAMHHVMSSPQLARRLATAARGRAAQYDIAHIGARWQQLFSDLCSRPKAE